MDMALFRQMDGVNLFTLGNVPLSLLTVIFSIQGHYEAAILCILYAGCIDLFDGLLARQRTRMPEQVALGQRLDRRYIVLPIGALVLTIVYGVPSIWVCGKYNLESFLN